MPDKKIKNKKGEDTRIRLSFTTLKNLKALKRGGESYNMLIKRSMLKPKRRRRK